MNAEEMTEEEKEAMSGFPTEGSKLSGAAVEFAKVERPSFKAEVGKVDGDLVFHFWPAEDERYSAWVYDGDKVDSYDKECDTESWRWMFLPTFEDAMAESFLEVFKFQERLQAVYTPELVSWAVRAAGFGDNLMKNELAEKLFDVLQRRLET